MEPHGVTFNGVAEAALGVMLQAYGLGTLNSRHAQRLAPYSDPQRAVRALLSLEKLTPAKMFSGQGKAQRPLGSLGESFLTSAWDVICRRQSSDKRCL